jgi:hypothetical protein
VSLYQIPESLRSITPLQIALGLTALSIVMLVIQDRRFSLVALLMQYILLGSLIEARVYSYLVVARVGLGIAICLMLYISATRVQHDLRQLRATGASEKHSWPMPLARGVLGPGLAELPPIFRLLAMCLGALIAYGLWRAYPLTFIPQEIAITSYGLIAIGLLLTLTSLDPLRMGMGLLIFVNGFVALYLFLEQSLVVMTLVGVIEIILTIGIVICTEAWLESLKEVTA